MAEGKNFENPPGLGQFQLVIDRTQRVYQLLILFRFESRRGYRRSLRFVCERDISRLCSVSGSLDFCNCIGRWHEGRGAWFYEGVE